MVIYAWKSIWTTNRIARSDASTPAARAKWARRSTSVLYFQKCIASKWNESTSYIVCGKQAVNKYLFFHLLPLCAVHFALAAIITLYTATERRPPWTQMRRAHTSPCNPTRKCFVYRRRDALQCKQNSFFYLSLCERLEQRPRVFHLLFQCSMLMPLFLFVTSYTSMGFLFFWKCLMAATIEFRVVSCRVVSCVQEEVDCRPHNGISR